MDKKCVLIADTRERNVLRHEREFEAIVCEVKQITTGDYVILAPSGSILVVIERKSLEDFAASLKDGRHDNKRKLVELREQTNCRIVYIIEGPEFPDPNKCFGNIPYRYIESSIFHLIIREGITILRTKDSLDTAKTLSRFVQSMETLCCKMDDDLTVVATPIVLDETPKDEVITLLTRKHEKTDHEIVRELWSCFHGIATESADEYMKIWSLVDIISGRVNRKDILEFKLASGRKISKRVVDSLTNINKLMQTRLLSTVPGISHTSAVIILETADLRNLLSWNIEGLSMVFSTKAKKRIGNKLAEKIIHLFNYKYVSRVEHPEPTSITDSELNSLLNDIVI